MYKMCILFKQDKHMLQYFVSTFYFHFLYSWSYFNDISVYLILTLIYNLIIW